MVNAKFAKAIVSVGIAAVCAAGLAACSSSEGTGGVAATVNGTEIAEDDVTASIESIRSQVIQSAQSSDDYTSDDDAWGEYLVAIGETPESLREEYIDQLVEEELVKSGAADKGVTVDEEEVESYVKEFSANYDSEEEWQSILEQAGFTEESYRDIIRESLMEQALQETFENEVAADDAEVLETADLYAQYYSGAKRSSHILIKVDDMNDEEAVEAAIAKAEEIIELIESGEMDFAEAAREYSEDTSADNGGDVGWDRLSSFVTEYTDALDALELDEVSGPVQSQYGIHIIKCTEVFNAPEKLKSLDEIPEAFRSTIESTAKSSAANTAYQAWVDSMKEKAEIVINPMPAKVPYNIDLTPYQEAEETSADVEDDGVIELADDGSVDEEAETTEAE